MGYPSGSLLQLYQCLIVGVVADVHWQIPRNRCDDVLAQVQWWFPQASNLLYPDAGYSGLWAISSRFSIQAFAIGSGTFYCVFLKETLTRNTLLGIRCYLFSDYCSLVLCAMKKWNTRPEGLMVFPVVGVLLRMRFPLGAFVQHNTDRLHSI